MAMADERDTTVTAPVPADALPGGPARMETAPGPAAPLETVSPYVRTAPAPLASARTGAVRAGLDTEAPSRRKPARPGRRGRARLLRRITAFLLVPAVTPPGRATAPAP